MVQNRLSYHEYNTRFIQDVILCKKKCLLEVYKVPKYLVCEKVRFNFLDFRIQVTHISLLVLEKILLSSHFSTFLSTCSNKGSKNKDIASF